MPVPILAIADSIVAALNGHTFSRGFTAARSYQPEYVKEELSSLQVTVVPKGDEAAFSTRATDRIECQIDVAVQKQLPGNDREGLAARIAEADALMGVVDEVKQFLGRASFAVDGVGTWKIIRRENAPIYDPKHWKELGVFTSVCTLTLAGPRAAA